MIETRAQRKTSTLMRRRKIGIIVTLAVVALLAVVLTLVYNYVNTVIPYYDVDDTEYHIKMVGGVYVMCNKDGTLLPIEPEFHYYTTKVGTMTQLDPLTGEIKEKVIPDFYDPTLSETVDHEKILIFPHLSSESISAIDINNVYESDGFRISRYNLATQLPDQKSDFVLFYKNLDSTLLDLKEESVSALYVAAGYALATGKIDPEEVAKYGYGEYGLEEEVRTRRAWAYKIVFTTSDGEHTYYVNMFDGKILSEETVKDAVEPTYDMTLPTEGITTSKAVTIAKNDLNYKGTAKINCTLLVYEETYNYVPASYVIYGIDNATGKNISHKMIIGDRLINGGGYYAQYVDTKTGERRDTVYTLGGTIDSTLLAPAKSLVKPGIAYPTTSTNYFDVSDFTICQKADDTVGNYEDVITFSFIDMADREDTVEGIHPYKFTKGEFTGFRPNYDNIDACLLSLMDPIINEICVLSPSAADKIAYGIASPKVDENGNIVYDKDGNIKCEYDAQYKVTFYRTETDADGKEHRFLQTMYISEPNYDGNYYVYTIVDFPSSMLSLDTICEVSSSTLNFLTWDSYDWVYPSILQTGILYTEEITVKLPDYSIDFTLEHSKEGELNVIEVLAEDTRGNSISTFGLLKFVDVNGNTWVVTPADIKVYDPTGGELKPSSRHYDRNSMGDQVRVIDNQITAKDGRRIRIMKDSVEIVYLDGSIETILRHHTTIFKKLFSLIIGFSLVDSYEMTDEEEAALIADPDKFIGKVTLTDEEGGVQTVELYKLTERKTYVVVNGSGGFYLSASYVNKIIEGIDLFIEGKDIKLDK